MEAPGGVGRPSLAEDRAGDARTPRTTASAPAHDGEIRSPGGGPGGVLRPSTLRDRRGKSAARRRRGALLPAIEPTADIVVRSHAAGVGARRWVAGGARWLAGDRRRPGRPARRAG